MTTQVQSKYKYIQNCEYDTTLYNSMHYKFITIQGNTNTIIKNLAITSTNTNPDTKECKTHYDTNAKTNASTNIKPDHNQIGSNTIQYTSSKYNLVQCLNTTTQGIRIRVQT